MGQSPSNIYVITDGTGTNVPAAVTYTTNGLIPVTFTLTSSNSYRFVAGTNAAITNTLAGTNPIKMLILSNNSQSSGYANSLYIGSMSVVSYDTVQETNLVNSAPVIRSSSTAGIPDTWWEQYFPGNTSAWVAANDPDADGQSNGAEYAAGTSPTSADSVFAITSFSRSAANVSVTWSAVSNKIYQVQTNGNLAGSVWQSAGPNVTNSSGAASLSNNIPMADPAGFLRVLLVP
jgi:hypothetical protein